MSICADSSCITSGIDTPSNDLFATYEKMMRGAKLVQCNAKAKKPRCKSSITLTGSDRNSKLIDGIVLVIKKTLKRRKIHSDKIEFLTSDKP
uniref:Signal recognition particle 14 kDa protein n=1 Tax=Rhabditophanes sp. KR3021 TaxID=114890 RepID=A0AC35TH72_9BILA